MPITQVLAVALVTDIDASVAWYRRILDRPETSRPMPSLADFHVTDTGWLQVFVDPERAGRAAINFAVTDFAETRDRLAADGVDVGGEMVISDGSRVLPLFDPDGNVVTLLEKVREG